DSSLGSSSKTGEGMLSSKNRTPLRKFMSMWLFSSSFSPRRTAARSRLRSWLPWVPAWGYWPVGWVLRGPPRLIRPRAALRRGSPEEEAVEGCCPQFCPIAACPPAYGRLRPTAPAA
ncbi:unnamed protein product, partial [Prorocentrum cordatum]